MEKSVDHLLVLKKGKGDLETGGCLALCLLMEVQVQDSAVS